MDEPKSEQSRRVVPVGLLPGVVDALRAFLTVQARDRLAASTAYQDSGYVVVDELGAPPRPEWYSDRFRRQCRHAGVPVIRLHAMRHIAADVLIRAGMPAIDVAAWLGHTPDVRHKHYGRATAGGVSAVGQARAAADGSSHVAM